MRWQRRFGYTFQLRYSSLLLRMISLLYLNYSQIIILQRALTIKSESTQKPDCNSYSAGSPFKKSCEYDKKPAARPLPTNPMVSETSWTAVVRNGPKKARTTMTSTARSAPTAQPNKPRARPASKIGDNWDTNVKGQSDRSLDIKLFLRLPVDHEWRKLSPAGIRDIIVRKLSISPTLIGLIKIAHSGFALSHCTHEGRVSLLQTAPCFSASNAKLEPALN